jgi:hypothetical protein
LSLIRPDVRRERHESRNLDAGNGLAADTELAAALGRVLDPVESLRQERFQSEESQTAQTEATADATAPWPRKNRSMLARLSLRLRYSSLRLRYSTHAPYRQIREAVFWAFVMIPVMAIVWVVLHMS